MTPPEAACYPAVVFPLTGIVNLLYPPRCLLCSACGPDRDPVCVACTAALPDVGRPCCRACGRPVPGAFDAAVSCAACRARPPAFDAARSLWQYEGLARRAIHAYKYERRWRLARWMAEPLADAVIRAAWDHVDAVVPVPRHWLKARWRGFDHTAYLAGVVSAQLEVPCRRLLRRRRWTAAQHPLTGPERRRNVHAAFTAAAGARGQRLLLIDDVLTSGATAEACARALRQAGAKEVYVLTAAVTASSAT